ncbi:BatD family protein [Vulgatibacter incomptus]|uniref:BatD n=1 Tax=Vulgatibacter incomptus TaxID=1391653 RepID=A0A0K1P8Z0_9BACT|nr:BatD family protein [Vulgatibacter incomptus]AKU89990.1 BatD [Vulgatibacter incomptus]
MRGAGLVRAAMATALLLAHVGLPFAARADDALEYYATVDRDSIGLDETVTLSVTLAVNGNKEPKPFELPQAPDFDVVSQGRSEQYAMGFGTGGGGFKKTRVYTIVLRPTREGELAIRPGVAVLEGRRYETGRLTIRVGGTGQGQARNGPAPRASPRASPFGGFPGGFPPLPGQDDDFDPFGTGAPPAEGDVLLRASVDKREVYPGEQVTLTIALLSRMDVGGIDGFQIPKFDGFWTEDLESPTQISGQTKVIDGVPWRVYLLRRRALFPLRDGVLSIQPAEVDVVTGNGFFSRRGKAKRRSQPIEITVKPLPGGAPAGFAPASVGTWTLDAEASPKTAAWGAPITLRLSASGVGNLRSLELPKLPEIDGMKTFEPTLSDEVTVQRGHFGGRRTLEYVLVPERAGAFTIPALELPYFDPATETFDVAKTASIELTVLPGKEAAPQPAAPEARPMARGDDSGGLAGIRTAAVLEGARTPLHERPWFVFALGLPALALLGSFAVPRLRAARERGEGDRRAKGAGRLAQRRLAGAQALADDGDPRVFEELDRALHAYLESRYGRSAFGLTRDRLSSFLTDAGAPPHAIEALRDALDACDAGRFAPGTMDAGAARRALSSATGAVDALEAGRSR